MLLTTCNWFFLWLFVGKIKALSIIISQFYGASHARYISLNPYNNSVTWVFLSSIYRQGNGFCGSSKVKEKGTGTLKHKLPDAKDSFHCTIVSYLKDPEEVSKEVVKETYNLKKIFKKDKNHDSDLPDYCWLHISLQNTPQSALTVEDKSVSILL